MFRVEMGLLVFRVGVGLLVFREGMTFVSVQSESGFVC